ncbi:NADP-dependent phosphogluconate dehydrogenase [Patescibacteria group bacterium]|nr:NADP-dependent phosphogluconate dehydrogenase [Patescibacteria group bacterium]
MRKQIGYIGLGKMGGSMVQRLKKQKWRVETYDVSGKGTVKSLGDLVAALARPRVVWVMVPAGRPVDTVIVGLAKYLQKGDIVIDGGNSFYENSVKRGKKLKKKGIFFLDAGVSGGPGTVRLGKPAIMVGGEKRVFKKMEPLFSTLTRKESFGYMGKSGAGHFVKMVHNGIEYGMMQALAEGFTVLKKAPFKFRLRDIAKIYNQNSIITSRLTGWLEQGLKEYGEDLKKASFAVAHTREGEWTVKTAKELKVSAPIIKGAFDFRIQSKKNPSFTGKILSTLRAVFGGHKI